LTKVKNSLTLLEVKVVTPLCQFCQTETAYAPLMDMKGHAEIFFCSNCQAEYLYYTYGTETISAFSISLYTEINDKMYRWTIYRDFYIHRATLWWVGDPGIPGVKSNRKMKCLWSCSEEMPELTPQNVKEKISHWLSFL
jgi:hypothetical protein